jgi:hypothetical protein
VFPLLFKSEGYPLNCHIDYVNDGASLIAANNIGSALGSSSGAIEAAQNEFTSSLPLPAA